MANYEANPKQISIKRVLLIAAVVLLILLLANVLGILTGGSSKMNGKKLRCVVSQDVTIFGDRILYYDNQTLFCLSAAGNELWSVSIGEGADFHASDKHVVVWANSQVQVFDRNGSSSYSDRMTDEVQFARIGEKYVAIVSGTDMNTILTVKDLDGTHVDVWENTYAQQLILDCGFFGNGEYLWTTALDVYGAVPETTLNTYQVDKMDIAAVSLGEPITYSVLYSGEYLNVINTRQLRLYDFRGTQSTEDTVLVYGWELIDSVATSGYPYLLFATVLQSDADGAITELRLLRGKEDTRYSLPNSCVGAAIRNKKIYAFSSDSLYRADINAQRFTALRLPVDGMVTDYLGMTSEGVALLCCGSEVWAVTLP